MTSIFSKILSGEEEGSFVYRDELVSAFMDIEPVNPGHTLVVPNVECTSISELDDKTAGHLFIVAKRIASAIRASDLPCDGINLYLADGEVAGQEVFHVHLHVVPRITKDGFQLAFPGTGYFKAERQKLDEAAKSIQAALK